MDGIQTEIVVLHAQAYGPTKRAIEGDARGQAVIFFGDPDLALTMSFGAANRIVTPGTTLEGEDKTGVFDPMAPAMYCADFSAMPTERFEIEAALHQGAQAHAHDHG